MTRIRNSTLPIHLIAASAALIYIWQVSQSAFVATGLQFIAPVLVIMATHLIWLVLSGQLSAGFSNRIYTRSAATALGMFVVIAVASVTAPQPAYAQDFGQIAGAMASVVFCAAIIVLIAAIILGIFYLFVKLFRAVSGTGTDDDGPKSRFFDVGSLLTATVLIGGLSAEGLTQAYSFSTANTAQARIIIAAQPDHVWTTMQTATSPAIPLPAILSNFPKPTDVVVDEGVDLGAMRQVAFQGREGAGHLTLQVTDRAPTRATFTVLSDTSPYAAWITHNTLTYETRAVDGGTELIVSLEYDRVLAPSWFFTPLTQGAASLAMDVLAGDVKQRAEGI